MRDDESMASLRDKTTGGEREEGNEAETETMEKYFIIELVIMKLPGTIASERAIKDQIISFSTGYLVNILR